MPDDYLTGYPDVGPECGHPGSLANPAGCKDCRIEELEKQLATARREALEAAAHKLMTMRFTWPVGNPDMGPFTREQIVVDAVCNQGAGAIRSLAPTPQRGDAATEGR